MSTDQDNSRDGGAGRLLDAVRKARIAEADRTDVVVELREATRTRLELLAQDEVCRDLQVAPGLAPNATAGLREFYQALARVDAQMIAGMPADTQQPCDLAYGVYAAGAPFAQGLPVAEVRAKRKQMMVDLEPEFAVEPSLFTLPEGYRRITMGAF